MPARLLSALGERAGALLAAGIAVGVALPPLAAALQPWLGAGVAVLLFMAVLRLDVKAALHHARRPALLAATTFWLLVGAPVAVWLTAGLLGLPDGLAAAMVLMAAAPPLASAPSIAYFLGLDSALALVLVIGGGLAAPLTLPLVVPALLGTAADVPSGVLFLRLAGLIGGAAVAAALVRRWTGEARLAAHAARLDGLTVLVLFLVAIAIMDGMAQRIVTEPNKVAGFAAAAFAANLALWALGALLFAPLGVRTALSAGYCTGTRNMLLVVVALGLSPESDAFLYFAVYQFPIYLLPAVLRPLTATLVKRA